MENSKSKWKGGVHVYRRRAKRIMETGMETETAMETEKVFSDPVVGDEVLKVGDESDAEYDDAYWLQLALEAKPPDSPPRDDTRPQYEFSDEQALQWLKDLEANSQNEKEIFIELPREVEVKDKDKDEVKPSRDSKFNSDLVFPFDGHVYGDEDVDEELTREDRMRNLTISCLYRNAPFGHYMYRSASYTSTPSHFKFPRLVGDDLLLQSLDDAQCHTSLDESAARRGVALILTRYAYPKPMWVVARRDDGLYASLITTASSLVFILYSSTLLVQIAGRDNVATQMDKIWKACLPLREERISVDCFCTSLASLVRDAPEYSLVSEIDLAKLCSYYSLRHETDSLVHPSSVLYKVIDAFQECENKMITDILKVLGEMKSSPSILKANEYTRFLMRLLREPVGELEMYQLLEDIKQMVDPKAIEQDDLSLSLHSILNGLPNTALLRMKHHLMEVVRPLLEFFQPKSLSIEVPEIVQIAELRCIAQGSRFIGRSQLLWAFYELGYGLPPKLRYTIKVHSDEDHPPYHIYRAARKLADLLGLKTTHLEHFIFAVIYSKHVGCDGEAIDQLLPSFKNFEEALLCTVTPSPEVETTFMSPEGNSDGSGDDLCGARDSERRSGDTKESAN